MTLMTNTIAAIDGAGCSGAHFDGVGLQALARYVPTPLHTYSANTIRQRITGLQPALHGLDALTCFAARANSNIAILQLMNEAGTGADIVAGHRTLRRHSPPPELRRDGRERTPEHWQTP